MDARNTISRANFDGLISTIYEDVFKVFQKEGAATDVVQKVRAFEERFRDEPRTDRVERISNEIASAGIFVPDPAGGPSNLRLPHKQFYDYLIAKCGWITLVQKTTLTASALNLLNRRKNSFEKLLSEDLSLHFFAEMIEEDYSIFNDILLKYFMAGSILPLKIHPLFIKNKGLSIKHKKNMYYYANHDTPESVRRFKKQFLLAYLTSLFGSTVMFGGTAKFIEVANGKFDDFTLLLALFLLSIFITLASITTNRSALTQFSFIRLAVFRRIIFGKLESESKLARRKVLLLDVHQKCLSVLRRPPAEAHCATPRGEGDHNWRSLVDPIS